MNKMSLINDLSAAYNMHSAISYVFYAICNQHAKIPLNSYLSMPFIQGNEDAPCFVLVRQQFFFHLP